MIRGYFRFGDVEYSNVVTANGKSLIAKYLAGIVPSYAGAIIVGSGSNAASATDNTLGFEYARIPITLRNVSGPQSVGGSEIYQVSFKGTLPDQLQGVISESGIISQTFNNYSGSYGDRLIARFDYNENWTTDSSTSMSAEYQPIGFESLSAVRVGGEGLRVYATAGGSSTLTTSSSYVRGDFSGYSSLDQFRLAIATKYVATGTTIQLRLYSSTTDYWYVTLTPTVNTSGSWSYQILSTTKSQFLQSGSPTWSQIVSAKVVVSASNASTNLLLDGLAAIDTDYISPDYALTSRALAPNPIIKNAGKPMDVEYFMEFRL